MSKIPVSVVISAYNEEKKIEACLQSVDWADEIIFIDNSSSDKTPSIAKKYTKHVFVRENNLMLNVNKNYGFKKAKNDWVLSLDADERITPELAEEIKNTLVEERNETVAGYWIPRKNIIFGKWIQNSIWWPDYQLRLFRKDKGSFPEKHVHEMIQIDGETVKLTQPMVHENYQTISQFLYKMDKIYTESEVENFIKSGKELLWVDAIRMPVGDFLKTFFLQKGYKDGLHGLVLSFLQAFYAEVTFAKIWERQGFKEYNNATFLSDIVREFKKSAAEIYYWVLTVSMEETKSSAKKIFYRVRRKNIQRKI